MLDSCGTSGSGETPHERSEEEAHRPPRGKQAPGAESNGHYHKPSSFMPSHSALKLPIVTLTRAVMCYNNNVLGGLRL